LPRQNNLTLTFQPYFKKHRKSNKKELGLSPGEKKKKKKKKNKQKAQL